MYRVSDSSSWYLDRLAAEQKRRVHQQWIRSVSEGHCRRVVLKTDLFEEANGAGRILNDLFPDTRLAIGMDLSVRTAQKALRRNSPAFESMSCDVRHLPLRTASVDVVISTSTLDHFELASDIDVALDEMIRVLRPGGSLIVTLDNPRNPGYHLLRWMSRKGWLPFELGATQTLATLEKMIRDRGMRISSTTYLIHNPRGISTVLYLAIRKVMGGFGDPPIRFLLV